MGALSRLCPLILTLAIPFTVYAQLSAGDIMFVGFNTDGTDGFSIVALEDIPANSTIYFNDNEWNELPIGGGGAFMSNTEHEFTWSSPAAIIEAGSVVNFSGTSASQGILSGGAINFSNENEVLYAFEGSDDETPTTFLSAISNSGFSASSGSLNNTGLTAGINAIEITGSEDVMIYSGDTNCDATKAACAAMIANSSNWMTQDGSGDQSQDASFPDFPDDLPSMFDGDALPVELVEFVGLVQDGKVVLRWKTASELNNFGFEIQKSLDGISYAAIGFEKGSGNSSVSICYDFIDDEFYQSAYYRLKQVDFDGDSELSKIIFLRRERNGSFRIYPNPFSDEVKIHAPSDEFRMKVFDLSGRDLIDENMSTDMAEVVLEGLQSGTYILIIGNKHFNKMLRIIKE